MSDAFDRAIGELIRLRREGAGLTQADVARAVGLTRASISNIEAGRQRFNVEMLYKLAAALGCKPYDLMPETRLVYQKDYKLPDDLTPEEEEWIRGILDEEFD